MYFCQRCKRYLTIDKFGSDKSRKSGKSIYCKSCRAKLAKEARIERPHVNRNYLNLRKYGLTKESYEDLLNSQDGKCAICGTTEPGGGKSNLYVDHDHSNGKVRGLLCRDCNLMLGHGKDKVDILESGVKYLIKYGSTKG